MLLKPEDFVSHNFNIDDVLIVKPEKKGFGVINFVIIHEIYGIDRYFLMTRRLMYGEIERREVLFESMANATENIAYILLKRGHDYEKF